MKFLTLLSVTAAATALVLPEGEVFDQIIASQDEPSPFLDHIDKEVKDGFVHFQDAVKEVIGAGEDVIGRALSYASDLIEEIEPSFQCFHSMTAFDAQGWLDSSSNFVEDLDIFETDHPRHKRPAHHPHHHKSNKTVYELISGSKYTTKLAKLIDEYPDLVKKLNGTAANYTVFAPTDKAFEKIPHHGDHKPSKEQIEKVLSYHISDEFYPLGRILGGHTVPTTLEPESLGGPQRLRASLGLRGLRINFYSRIIASNIFGSNGVIHAVDHILLPPPSALKIISLLPSEFSTLTLALEKTGLLETFENGPHVGGTFFAPSNAAFKWLGPRANAFLFSQRGLPFLKALLKYHVSVNQTLYSDAFYKAKDVDPESLNLQEEGYVDGQGFPKGHFRVDLPTLLRGKPVEVNIGRYGGLINIRINGRTSVSVQDGLANDGVIQAVRSIIVPPRHKHHSGDDEEGGFTVEDLIERLEPFVERDIYEEL